MPSHPPEQMELFGAAGGRTPEELHEILRGSSRRPLALAITRNSVSMVSVRFADGGARVRLDRGFLAAPEPVIAAVRDYVHTRSKAAWRTVCEFVRSLTPEPQRRARAPRVRSRGRVYDLAAIRDRVNERFFNRGLRCRIAWGRAPARRRRFASRRFVRFGCYVKAQDLVRVNPLLDDPRVPEAFVEYIVFHEMLHAAVPSDKSGGRWNHHHAGYRALEQQYPDIARMRRLATELVQALATPARNATRGG